ncbi:FAD-binding oxidoreductase [Candidatus Parcubacteria bacterium]|nr:FAD-binding oxidoreductase [Candidatus Parcubacteria bacterium]
MNKLKQIFIRKITYVILIILIAIVVVIQRVIYLSEGPKLTQKACPPLFPDSEDGSQPTNIKVDALARLIPWEQRGGSIDDASCLDKTAVFGIVEVKNESDIKNALIFAKENNLKVSIAGVKHSMGGQAFLKGAMVLNMVGFNKKILNEAENTMTVQSGATWHDIQNWLHPKYAVKAMQSTDIFTVGGSISVNAHGMDHQVGSLGKTIQSLRIMLPDGTIKTASRTENPELFNLVIGGYGLFGVVLDAKIDITENVLYRSERKVINYTEFLDTYNNQINSDPDNQLFYGHLSTGPQSFLKEMILYTYKKVDEPGVQIPPLAEVSAIPLRRLMINFSKQGYLGATLKWFAEKYIEPKLESCDIKSRAQALGEGEACLVSRNEPMHDSVKYLKNNLKNDTDILQEYFIPRGQFVPFVDEMRKVLLANHANLLNASVRVIHKEDNFLNYAPQDSFAIVLYLNQKTDAQANQNMAKLTSDLIDLSNEYSGRFFLPYQLHYTFEQLKKSYPEINGFFADKKKYDPDGLFRNTFYEKYSNQI